MLGARQTGKTSFLYKIRASLEEQGELKGALGVIIDFEYLSEVGVSEMYQYVADQMLEQLSLRVSSLNNEREGVAEVVDPVEFTRFLQRVVSQLDHRLVVMLDEPEAVLPEVADSLARTLRGIFSQKLAIPAYREIVFVLSGSLGLYEFMAVEGVSPLSNVVEPLYLADLTAGETHQLVENLERAEVKLTPEAAQRIYEWTSGHPYLTQRICFELEKADRMEPIDVDVIDQTANKLLTKGDSHFLYIRKHLDNAPRLVREAQKILDGAKIKFDRQFNRRIAELELIGIIKEGEESYCAIRNLFYESFLRKSITSQAEEAQEEIPGPNTVATILESRNILQALITMFGLATLILGVFAAILNSSLAFMAAGVAAFVTVMLNILRIIQQK